MLRMNIDMIKLGQEFQNMEHRILSVVLTSLTHQLSFQLLEINAKSINVWRNLSLLNLQKSRDHPPRRFHILLIAVMYYPSLGITLFLLHIFAADSTTQGGEVKGRKQYRQTSTISHI